MATRFFTAMLMLVPLSFGGCASDNDSEKFFRQSKTEDGVNRIPFDGRSECLPFGNNTPPDDCPDE